jgi:hypothetical protein
MMPISHVYVATKVAGRSDALLVYGSVLCDVATTSGGKIPRNKIHDAPGEFCEFVKEKYPQLTDLALGVKLHSGALKGADYYSDDPETGFALFLGKKIKDLVGGLLQSDNEGTNLVLAHNFIEAGVELNLLKKHPEMMKLYEESVTAVNFGEISECIAEFADVDKNMVSSELVKFCYWLDMNNLSSPERLTEGLIVPMISIRLGKSVKKEEVMNILNEAMQITQIVAMEYLDEAVAGMSGMIY